MHSAPKRIHPEGLTSSTFGDLAARLSAEHGLVPDGWQAEVLDDWLQVDEHDKWVALTCGLSVPRQNGKNAILEMRELFGAVILGESILHSAHEVKTAQKHFRRLKQLFGDSAGDPAARWPDLNAMVDRVRSVNGQEAILLKNGGGIEITARSKSSARGFTNDVLVLDEAQELTDDALEAILPSTSAAPLRNPQWIYTGTPPGPLASGDVFTRVRQEALGDSPGRSTWSEWSPPQRPDKVDLDDRALWRAMNPALESGRLQMAVLEGERGKFSPDGFARERLGVWPVKVGRSRAIPADVWRQGDAQPPASGCRSFAVAFSIDGEHQAVAGGVRDGERVHVNLIGEWTGPIERGVRQLADWLSQRRDSTAQISLLGGAGSAPLLEALVQRKVPRRMVHVMSTSEYLDACAMMVESVASVQLTHPAADERDALELSVACCDRVKRRRDGAFGWGATTPEGDELPLEAVSAVNWTARVTKRRPCGVGNKGAFVL